MSDTVPTAGARVEGMRFVPGGAFAMGTDSSELEGILADLGSSRVEMLLPEVPRHDVVVEPFLLDTVDVTNADFMRFVDANPQWSRVEADPERHNGRYLEHWSGEGPVPPDRDRPVTFVTWHSAVAFCDWKGKRLPTEREWEWAARGGQEPVRYPWGNAAPADSLVSWGADGMDQPVPVASYPPNGYGLYDMSGNVWKFLADEWGPYPLPAARLAPDTALAVRTRRVVRGGSWGAAAANLRVRYRDSHRPEDAREMVGFRCARAVGT